MYRILASLGAAFAFSGIALAMPMAAQSQAAPSQVQSADELVAQLRQFEASLPASEPSSGIPDPKEVRRRALYDELWRLGSAAMPALSRGLADPDVQVRRNVALFLIVAAKRWYEPSRPPLDARPCLQALITALADSDSRVRGLAAQAVGVVGPDAAAAVPALVALLGSADEGSRNSACIGLTGIGPTAREALPALREALSDSSEYVRRFAQRAIDAIEKSRDAVSRAGAHSRLGRS